MLVYLKEQMGYGSIEGQRVYGRKYARGTFGPTDIPYSLWEKHKNCLAPGEYTSKWLETKYKKQFPDIVFTIDSLKELDDSMLSSIAKLVGVLFVDKPYNRSMDLIERRALIKSIILALNDAL